MREKERRFESVKHYKNESNAPFNFWSSRLFGRVSSLQASSSMSSGYYNPRGQQGFTAAVSQNVERVWNAVGDIANQRQHNLMDYPNNNSARRINAAAAQGADLTQLFDPIGNNRYTDASNPWAAFFGAPAQPWKTASYDKYDRDSYMLPEAYNGQNEYLGKTITKMIYDDETYYTQVLMPIRFTNQMAVSWDVWTFNQTFTGMVPELGVSRLVSSHRETHSDTIVRRGLAARFEHGFMDTPEGRAHYFLTLAQIANAVRETLNFGVIYAYLTCHDYNKVRPFAHLSKVSHRPAPHPLRSGRPSMATSSARRCRTCCAARTSCGPLPSRPSLGWRSWTPRSSSG